MNIKKTAVVFGSTQGIGLELTRGLLSDDRFSYIFASHRPSSSTNELLALKETFPNKLELLPFDTESMDKFTGISRAIESKTKAIDLVVNCIGALSIGSSGPERSLKEFEVNSFLQAIQTNTTPTLLIAKHLESFLKQTGESVFISLSAKVGSLEDNKTGGWYSYRISKAALNMAIKNLSIEFNRFGKGCSFIAVHPGTTETKLSQPFLKAAANKYVIHSPAETAQNILKIAFSPEVHAHNGKFISWDGQEIPW